MSVANFVKLILGYCIMIARELAIPVCSSMTISCSCVQYIYIQLYSPFLVEEKYNTFCILVTDLQWMYVNNLEDYSRSSKLMYNVHISLIRKGCEVFLVWWVSLFVCLSACISRKPHLPNFTSFVHVACSRGSVLGVAIRYVLPVVKTGGVKSPAWQAV